MSARSIEAEVSIESGVQAECTIGREVIVEVHKDVNLDSLTVTANGSYEPSEGVDGFSDVTVAVPERVPVTESLSVTENGTYEPTEGIDGYDRVVVYVPPTIPDIEPLTVTANGVYTAEGDGFNPVTVNVESHPKIKTGIYIPPETYSDTNNHKIASIADIGFIPTKFYLSVSDKTSLGLTQNAIIKSSYEKTSDSDYMRLTTRYSNASGSIATSVAETNWTVQAAGYIVLVDGNVCFRTTTNRILIGSAEYEWIAIE